jgi:hypothetical protein
MSDFKPVLGPLVRLEGISISQLPSGGQGNDSTAAPSNGNGASSSTFQELSSFISKVFTEAIPFIDGVAPKAGDSSKWRRKGAPKKYSSCIAPVELYEYAVSGKELDKVEGMSQFSADRKDETWFCRRSVHKNAAEKGTATWEEFVKYFKEQHSESEEAFTPGVIGIREAMKWDANGIELVVEGGKWNNMKVVVEEMTHKIDPKPLKNRTFPVLQIAASLEGTQEFMVVSIPLNDFNKSPYAGFSKDKSLHMAVYASIERVRILESGEIEWIMGTASNAGGVLPQWIQNLAVPGAIAKDVDMFMSWVPSQRKTLPASAQGLSATSEPPQLGKVEHQSPIGTMELSSS